MVPGPPKSKDRPRHNRKTGNTYTPKETLEAEEKVRWCFKGGWKDSATTFPIPKAVRLAIEIDAYLPDRRLRDWDNIAKTCCDALNKACYVDDAQIREAHVKLIDDDPKNPRTHVRVYILGSEDESDSDGGDRGDGDRVRGDHRLDGASGPRS